MSQFRIENLPARVVDNYKAAERLMHQQAVKVGIFTTPPIPARPEALETGDRCFMSANNSASFCPFALLGVNITGFSAFRPSCDSSR